MYAIKDYLKTEDSKQSDLWLTPACPKNQHPNVGNWAHHLLPKNLATLELLATSKNDNKQQFGALKLATLSNSHKNTSKHVDEVTFFFPRNFNKFRLFTGSMSDSINGNSQACCTKDSGYSYRCVYVGV